LSVPKKAKAVLFRKEKRHTLKTQMLVSLKDGQIISLAFPHGKKHDFRLFKESHVHVLSNTLLEADTGYMGITCLHANSSLPKKTFKEASISKTGASGKQGDFQTAYFCGARGFVK